MRAAAANSGDQAPYPRVSCIVPAYNYGHDIAGAIESALDQDYEGEVEVVVVDDGSTDDTSDVVRPYLDDIRYIRQENAGINAAVNRAIAEATGELIAFLDADDRWTPQKLSTQVGFLNQHPEVGLLYGDLEVIDADGVVTHPSFWGAFGITPLRGKLLGPLLVRNFVTGGSIVVRAEHKDLFHPLPEEAAWTDWWIALQVAAVAEIDYVTEPVYQYRLHGENRNLGATGERLARALKREAIFRRWFCRDLEPGSAGAPELNASAESFKQVLVTLRGMSEEPLTDALPVDQADRARAAEAQAAAQATTDEAEAARLRQVALAHDPHAIFGPSLRSFVTLAFADELVESPELLAAYGQAFSHEDDATLLIALPQENTGAVIERLEAAVAAMGEGSSADMLAQPMPDLEAAGPVVHAVLTRQALPPALASHRTVADPQELKAA